jgi:hypothetical protein
MKKNLATPSWQAGRVRLADYAELCALRSSRRRVSVGDLIAGFDRSEDEDEDKFERPVLEAFQELADRIEHLGAAVLLYPFELLRDELRLRPAASRSDGGSLYLFLLLATVLNMRDERKHAGLDGADLFERLCAQVALRYFGGPADDRVKALVFGTARIRRPEDPDAETDLGSFEAAVNDLCKHLGEGRCFRAKTRKPIHARDDKLDVVVWRGFSDKRAAKLIGFGQCKTGTHWISEMPRLNPRAFCDRWFDTSPAVQPVKLFFLSDRVEGDLTYSSYEAGVLFDRCRILDYAHELPLDLISDCVRWANAAAKSCGFAS